MSTAVRYVVNQNAARSAPQGGHRARLAVPHALVDAGCPRGQSLAGSTAWAKIATGLCIIRRQERRFLPTLLAFPQYDRGNPNTFSATQFRFLWRATRPIRVISAP